MVKNTIKEILQQMEDLKQQIIDNVREIPDNPKIKRISDKPSCFIVNFKDLGDNWSPEYHDSKYQTKTIINIIKERDNLNSIQNMFEEIVNKGVYRVEPGHRMYFNNQVREYIKNLL